MLKTHVVSYENPFNTVTGIGVEDANSKQNTYISINHMEDLHSITSTEKGLKVGSAATIAYLIKALDKEIKKLPEQESRFYTQIAEVLQLYGSEQIRNASVSL